MPWGWEKTVLRRVPKRTMTVAVVLMAVLLPALGTKVGARWWTMHRMTRPAAGAPRIRTITRLPRLPHVPWRYTFRNPTEQERAKLLQDILAVKLSTYPTAPPFPRAGRHRTMGFANFEPSEAQLEILAAHYDVFYLSARAGHRIPVIKRCNPRAKVLMYFASSLTKAARLHDAGSVDEEDTEWILQHHRDWLLKDRQGRPVVGRSWSVKYWADPGNEEWQAFFTDKLNAALVQSGGSWDGVVLDEFLTGHESTAAAWAGGGPVQARCATDQAWQEAQLAFLRYVAPRVKVPLVVNVEPLVLNPTHAGFRPEFFTEVQRIAGGAEAEVFVFHQADRRGFLGREMVEVYLDCARRTPPGKMMFLNSATAAGFGGNSDLTLFSYFTYLLVASPEREVYWTCKEGDSEIPHFWYREFDLNLGPPREEMQSVGGVWKRDFAHATVVVNPGPSPASYSFENPCVDVQGQPVPSPVTLDTLTGILLIRDKAILPPAAPDGTHLTSVAEQLNRLVENEERAARGTSRMLTEARLSQALGFCAKLDAEGGRAKHAVQDLIACVRFGSDLKKRLLLEEQLTGMMIVAHSLRAGFQVLDRIQIDHDSLRFLQARLTELATKQNLVIDLAADRLVVLNALRDIYRAWPGSGGGANTRALDEAIASWLSSRLKADFALDLTAEQVYSSLYTRTPEEMASLVRRVYAYGSSIIAKTPFQQHEEEPDWDKAVWKSAQGNLLLLTLVPAVPSIAERSFRCRAERDALITTLALLRYQSVTGGFPAALEPLVSEAYMAQLPRDPYNDKPLVYRRTEDGFTLYSIGTDFRDDNGHRGGCDGGKEQTRFGEAGE
jgi:hypothetical protein